MSEDDWSSTEDAQLVNALRAGDSWSDIADGLLRGREEVIVRAATLQRWAAERAGIVEAKVRRLSEEAKAARIVHPTVPVGRRAEAVMAITSRPLPPPEPVVVPEPVEPEPVEPEPEAAPVAAPPKLRKGACSASYQDAPCILITRHRGMHLTDGGVIFSRDAKVSWRDTGDVYLVMSLNNEQVAP